MRPGLRILPRCRDRIVHPPLLGFTLEVPLRRQVPCASAPSNHKWLPSDDRCQTAITFRPRGFSPPRRLAPRTGCECIATRCQPGFAVFPESRFGQPKPTASRAPFPQRDTPRRIPLIGSCPHCCGTYPHAVTVHFWLPRPPKRHTTVRIKNLPP
jgi:hypothetical protein